MTFIPKDKLPEKLHTLNHLYYKGNIDLLSKHIISVIGKRDVTDRELKIAMDTGEYLEDML